MSQDEKLKLQIQYSNKSYTGCIHNLWFSLPILYILSLSLSHSLPPSLPPSHTHTHTHSFFLLYCHWIIMYILKYWRCTLIPAKNWLIQWYFFVYLCNYLTVWNIYDQHKVSLVSYLESCYQIICILILHFCDFIIQ